MTLLSTALCVLAVIFSQFIDSTIVSGRTFEDFIAELRAEQESRDRCNNGTFRSCVEEPTKISRPYQLKPFRDSPDFGAYCEQKSHGGGWLVVQHRFDGSEDFFRKYPDYRNGFGDLEGEFWIGLEKLYRLTANRNTQLLVELKDFAGIYKYAKYDEFEIGDEQEGYHLKKLGAYCGTAGDGLRYSEGMRFSTPDNDVDESKFNCAIQRMGAWWYKDCTYSNLNGLYEDDNQQRAMNWFPFKDSDDGLKSSKIMIRGY
ncbi:angiopoietin-related protein 1-like [Armigeres subalbatus]|uniref:angiopoietin-related protein 1-like n=1 Tax=Armigeres subalbatus TaxID=124917 RepID=UPI002ED0887C